MTRTRRSSRRLFGTTETCRAVVFVVAGSPKGTPRSGQEYESPLLALTGAEYASIPFAALHRRICDALPR